MCHTGDVAKHSTSAYTAGAKRVDADGRIATENERKRAKLNEMQARDTIEQQEAAAKAKEREEMEKAKEELKAKRDIQRIADDKQAQEDRKNQEIAKAEAAKRAKQSKLEAIKAARLRFAQRKKEQKNRPPNMAATEHK